MKDMPYRYVPPNRVRAERSQYAVITAQFQFALNSPYGCPLHLRIRKYLQEQEFLFRANVQEQHNRYSSKPAYDYSGDSESLPTYAAPLEPLLQESSDEEPIRSPYHSDYSISPSPPRSPRTIRLLEERKQAALQRQDALTPTVSSRASHTIARMNEQIQLDTAEGTTGTSSSRTTLSRPQAPIDMFHDAREESRSMTPNSLQARGINLHTLRPTIIKLKTTSVKTYIPLSNYLSCLRINLS